MAAMIAPSGSFIEPPHHTQAVKRYDLFLAGITARRNDSTGSGIFPALAADSVLDGTGMRQWSGAAQPCSATNGAASQAQQQPQRAAGASAPRTQSSQAAEAAAGHPAAFGTDAKSYTNPTFVTPQTDAQQPTFDAIFDDILAS